MFNVCRGGIFVKQNKSPDAAYHGKQEKQQCKNRIPVNKAVRAYKGSPAVEENVQEYRKINGTAPAGNEAQKQPDKKRVNTLDQVHMENPE